MRKEINLVMEQNETISFYMEELAAIPKCTEEEITLLAPKAASGDKSAKNRLIEGNLIFAVELAKEYLDKGLDEGELIAEANVALAMAVDSYRKGDFKSFIQREICYSLEEALEMESESEQISSKMADSINLMNEVTTLLAQKLGREATIAETAEAMQMSEEEVQVLMRTALDAINQNTNDTMPEEE
ncbi:MAG: sigma-70 domain-containing protein [Lachnospiraceae bacterium]